MDGQRSNASIARKALAVLLTAGAALLDDVKMLGRIWRSMRTKKNHIWRGCPGMTTITTSFGAPGEGKNTEYWRSVHRGGQR